MKYFIAPILVLLLTSFTVISIAAGEEDTLHIAVETRIMVFDRTQASEELTAWAENNGGYFTWKSEDSVRIRVPDEKIKSLAWTFSRAGKCVYRNIFFQKGKTRKLMK